jgi:hypothetical protein
MEKRIFNNPDIHVRLQAEKYFKRPAGSKNIPSPRSRRLREPKKMGKPCSAAIVPPVIKWGKQAKTSALS